MKPDITPSCQDALKFNHALSFGKEHGEVKRVQRLHYADGIKGYTVYVTFVQRLMASTFS